MAVLSAIEQKLQAQYKANQDASNANYQSQLDALTGKNTLDMAQANTAKNAIPSIYDPQRAGATLTMAQANSALPENVLNRGSSIGANGNSGLAYSMGRDIGNSYQKNMGLIGAAQNKDLNTAQQNIDNMGLTYNNNYNQLQTEKTGAANNIQAQGDTAMQNQINAEQAAKDAQAAAQAKAELDQQNFKQQIYTTNNNAQLARDNATSNANITATAKQLTPEQISDAAMNANGSKTQTINSQTGYATTTVDAIKAYENITAGLQANGIDPNSTGGQRAYARAGVTQNTYDKAVVQKQAVTDQTNAANAYNVISPIAAAADKRRVNGQYSNADKAIMSSKILDLYNQGKLSQSYAQEIGKHYGL